MLLVVSYKKNKSNTNRLKTCATGWEYIKCFLPWTTFWGQKISLCYMFVTFQNSLSMRMKYPPHPHQDAVHIRSACGGGRLVIMLMKSISALITQVPAHLENHLNLKQQQRLPSLPWGLDFIKVEFWLLIVPCAHEKGELEEIGGADIAENILDIHGSSSSRSAWGHKAIFLISMHPASPRYPPLNSQFPCDWLTGRSLQAFIAPTPALQLAANPPLH